MWQMNVSVRVLLLWTGLTCVAVGQPWVDIPPALVWDKLKGDCPASLDWASLRGKVVVVSFRSDDVFPEDIAEWAEVPPKFEVDSPVFFQIVTGSEFLLDQALSKAGNVGCVLLDSNDANRQNFKLVSAPWTVVVDQSGLIAGSSYGGPDESAIRSVRDHERVTSVAEVAAQPNPIDPPAAAREPLLSFEVHISAAQRGERRVLGQAAGGSYTSKNRPLKLIISDLWENSMARIVFPEKLDEGYYDLTAEIPVADRALTVKVVQEALERHFGLLVKKEERTEQIYVLRAVGHSSPQLQPASTADEWMSGGGQQSIIGTAQRMEDIAQVFEGLLNIPVVNETGIQGSYNYSASSKLSQPEAALDLAHQLGFELTQVERPVEMLVVRKAR